MPPVKCFMLEDTGKNKVSLIRYSYGLAPCPGTADDHYASVQLADAVDEDTYTDLDDPRLASYWPTKCDTCDYQFTADDHRAMGMHGIYRRADTGEQMLLRDAPPGAMWYADWISPAKDRSGPGSYRGPDGHCLMAKCPDGRDWCVDSPATNGPGWTRTGKAPNITATPSILTQNADGSQSYHGWLREGVFVDA